MSPQLPEPLIHRAAEHAMDYPYKLWGFGEDVALRGLLKAGQVLNEPSYLAFVHETLARWCRERPPLRPQDHVVPGVPLLILYEETGDKLFLEAAHDLGELYASFEHHQGIPVHRPDLADWNTTIWVDCMYMDTPFLLRLWHFTDEDRWLELGLQHLSSYAAALRDPQTGLFWHGYDTRTDQHSPCLWGRGNGWALLGLVETLEVLPREYQLYNALQEMLSMQVRSIAKLQGPSGQWHTVLTDPDAPLENSTAAIYAAGLQQARCLQLLPQSLIETCDIEATIHRAISVLEKELTPEGALEVSSATPVGDRDNYVTQTLGVYPWGQGPVLLAAAESLQPH